VEGDTDEWAPAVSERKEKKKKERKRESWAGSSARRAARASWVARARERRLVD
jgi:hypothetical protein